jgi:hypothetical protein
MAHPTRRSVPLLALLALLLPAPALAGPPAAPGHEKAPPAATYVIDYGRYRLPAAPRGARLAVPTDLVRVGEDSRDERIWSVDTSFENGTWLPFEQPYLETMAFSPESVAALLHAALADHADLDFDVDDADDREDAQVLRGSAAAVEAARRALPWVLQSLAPSVTVDAVLTEDRGQGGARLRAMGAARLWPGRWTRVYLQENQVPCVPTWRVEVAQESTLMDPETTNVSEGQELYLRLHPGETRSVVEVWSGDVQHLEIVRRDLGAVRNVPQVNGAGVVSFPRSAVERVYTQVVLPAGEGGRRELRWVNAGRRLRLGLSFGAAPRPAPTLPRGDHAAIAVLRAGAVASGLDFEARPKRLSAWNERLQNLLFGIAAAYESRGRTFQSSVSAVDGGSVFFVEAPDAEIPKVRNLVEEAETHLEERVLRLSTWTIPEPAYRKALLDGTVAVGRPLPQAARKAFTEAGATEGESVSTPCLLEATLGFRVGRSEPGLVDLEAELAQGSGGLAPVTSARFAGFTGQVRVRRDANGFRVRLDGEQCWADGEAGRMELTFRPPVPTKTSTGEAEARGGAPTRVVLPLLGGGRIPLDREVEVPAGGAEVLLHAHVRGQEVVALLVGVR